MTAYSAYKTRILQVLGDLTGARYADALIQEACRQALADYVLVSPQIKETVVTVASASRDQSLSALTDPRFVISLVFPYVSTGQDKLSQDVEYYFYFAAGVAYLHFSSDRIPAVGEQIKVKYASGHTISGLDSAVATTIPVIHDSLIVEGSSAYAMINRMQLLIESYGSKSLGVKRLQEQSQLHMTKFQEGLSQLQTYQPSFDFPEGFRLDNWDRDDLRI